MAEPASDQPAEKPDESTGDPPAADLPKTEPSSEPATSSAPAESSTDEKKADEPAKGTPEEEKSAEADKPSDSSKPTSDPSSSTTTTTTNTDDASTAVTAAAGLSSESKEEPSTKDTVDSSKPSDSTATTSRVSFAVTQHGQSDGSGEEESSSSKNGDDKKDDNDEDDDDDNDNEDEDFETKPTLESMSSVRRRSSVDLEGDEELEKGDIVNAGEPGASRMAAALSHHRKNSSNGSLMAPTVSRERQSSFGDGSTLLVDRVQVPMRSRKKSFARMSEFLNRKQIDLEMILGERTDTGDYDTSTMKERLKLAYDESEDKSDLYSIIVAMTYEINNLEQHLTQMAEMEEMFAEMDQFVQQKSDEIEELQMELFAEKERNEELEKSNTELSDAKLKELVDLKNSLTEGVDESWANQQIQEMNKLVSAFTRQNSMLKEYKEARHRMESARTALEEELEAVRVERDVFREESAALQNNVDELERVNFEMLGMLEYLGEERALEESGGAGGTTASAVSSGHIPSRSSVSFAHRPRLSSTAISEYVAGHRSRLSLSKNSIEFAASVHGGGSLAPMLRTGTRKILFHHDREPSMPRIDSVDAYDQSRGSVDFDSTPVAATMSYSGDGDTPLGMSSSHHRKDPSFGMGSVDAFSGHTHGRSVSMSSDFDPSEVAAGVHPHHHPTASSSGPVSSSGVISDSSKLEWESTIDRAVKNGLSNVFRRIRRIEESRAMAAIKGQSSVGAIGGAGPSQGKVQEMLNSVSSSLEEALTDKLKVMKGEIDGKTDKVSASVSDLKSLITGAVGDSTSASSSLPTDPAMRLESTGPAMSSSSGATSMIGVSMAVDKSVEMSMEAMKHSLVDDLEMMSQRLTSSMADGKGDQKRESSLQSQRMRQSSSSSMKRPIRKAPELPTEKIEELKSLLSDRMHESLELAMDRALQTDHGMPMVELMDQFMQEMRQDMQEFIEQSKEQMTVESPRLDPEERAEMKKLEQGLLFLMAERPTDLRHGRHGSSSMKSESKLKDGFGDDGDDLDDSSDEASLDADDATALELALKREERLNKKVDDMLDQMIEMEDALKLASESKMHTVASMKGELDRVTFENRTLSAELRNALERIDELSAKIADQTVDGRAKNAAYSLYSSWSSAFGGQTIST